MVRGRTCFIFFVLSIIFFVTSVCTFAVLAVTKEPTHTIPNVEIIEDHPPHVGQHIIIERLKALEKKMKKRKNKRNKK